MDRKRWQTRFMEENKQSDSTSNRTKCQQRCTITGYATDRGTANSDTGSKTDFVACTNMIGEHSIACNAAADTGLQLRRRRQYRKERTRIGNPRDVRLHS